MQSFAKPRALEPLRPLAVHLPSMSYVDVKMRWKKDASFDDVPVLSHARDLRPLVSLARLLSQSPTPVSAVSKLRNSLETPDRRVTSFLRRFPAAFVESVGPEHNLPWFRLSDAAVHLLREEREVFAAGRADVTGRLRRLVLMCPRRRIPLRVAQGMLWHLGIPDDYFKDPDHAIAQDGFRTLTSGDGVTCQDDDGRELGLIGDGKGQEMPLSVLQLNAMRKFGSVAKVPVPLFQSKGLRLKRKIQDWLEGFQRLPYVSPYEDFSHINPGSDVSDKRAVGEKTCYVVLKEAYMAGGDTAIEEHPMLKVRKKYIELMEQSREIIKCRRNRKPIELQSMVSCSGDIEDCTEILS
ncbi:hypothetical protein HU200_058562 [Digitaria exilis]|uniref:PORR domain-containing protein n=1 Tax=Digitaria exilis TaxID=1010633 RepID=A0A835E3Z2_9POAL|nr:hypothetical protein HU200_058562 [Digitaria exilis]